jgi:hypothetical protein
MKRTLVYLIISIFSCTLFAQTLTVSVPTVTASVGQQVYIPVKLSGASSSGVPISSANIQITYDTAVLRYDTLTNFYSPMPVNQWFFTGANGLVSANWLEPSLLTLAIPNNTTLYEIKFTKKSAGNSPLTFVVNEFTDAVYNLVPTTPVHGAVNAPLIPHLVTFKVDMSKENITSAGVHLAGSFNNWSPTANPMTLGPNSVYSTTISLTEGQNYTYRFVNGNMSSGMESVPSACGILNVSGQYERSVTIPTADTTLNLVCFGMCTACPVMVNVTFRVDMQQQNVSPLGVHIAGSFNNWNYLQYPMSNPSGTIYEFSQSFQEGSYLEFLYSNGVTAGDAEVIPATCATNGHRYFTVPSHDTILTAFCFDSCVACGFVPQYSNVTFRVDMKQLDSISVHGIHIAGTFQGWNPSNTAMSLVSDSIYSYTVSLLEGTQVEYRFINGNDALGYELVPLLCSTIAGNRSIIVPATDTTLIPVCFSACVPCSPVTGTGEQATNRKLILEQNIPNPCSDYTRVDFSLPSTGAYRLEIVDLNGQRVYLSQEENAPAGYQSLLIKTNDLHSGIYLYRLIYHGINQEMIARKMVIIK